MNIQPQRAHLRIRCDEILSWRKTGLYEGTRLQELADQMVAASNGVMGEDEALRAAEDATINEALEAVASATMGA